jgi:hypothetical protein
MTRCIRELALYVLVGLSVAGLALAQTPKVQQALEDEEALEEALEAQEGEEALEAAEAAFPQTGSLIIFADSRDPDYYCLAMWDYISMSQDDAQGYLNNDAYGLSVSLWGDDPSWDDGRLLFGTFQDLDGPTYYFYASSRGLEIGWSACFPRGVFDEDVGLDELYVKSCVSPIVPPGDCLFLRETPRWYGFYGDGLFG